jgi:hypothetical protein
MTIERFVEESEKLRDTTERPETARSILKRQTVCIADIRLDKCVPYDLYENTFVRSLVMAPAEKDPPVAALGAYWSWAHLASAQQVATVEARAEATGTAILRVRHVRSEQRSRGDNEPVNLAEGP